ncbi:MAG: purine-binding chemotaxis protein [Methanoregulaceae archaeon PtaB.Bin009]|nr:MAG: purine-binding chemotaxis protein [Methanoregulaceae archaeon PtaB.Bin009]OPY38868.1 MAG: purine-binding chemotaxis protein [Methanoregulaceae archaeon PtaU1.Bin066]
MTKNASEEQGAEAAIASARRSQQGAAAGGSTGTLQVVEFLLGKEYFAIDLFDVKEVVEYTTITKLPNTPAFIKGIIDLRGEITTIVDLKQRMRITEESDQPEENCRIIVLDEKNTKSKIGIMVDDVLSVSTFEMKNVDTKSASELGDEMSILGIIKKSVRDKEKDKETNELIIWIDIKQLLKDIDKHM